MRRALARAGALRLQAIVVLLIGTTVPATAAADTSRGIRRGEPGQLGIRILIIVVPRVSWFELRHSDMPALHQMMASGAVGLMPVAKPSDPDAYRTWVSLGAGHAAVGARELPVPRRRGRGAQVDLTPAIEANALARTGATLGLLGDHLGPALVGCGGTSNNQLACPAFWLAADGGGYVHEFIPDVLLRRAPGGPLDPEKVVAALREVRRAAVVLCLGDAARADRERPPRSVGHLTEKKAAALAATDKVIGAVLALLRSQDSLVYLISPDCPDYSDPDERSLGAVVYLNLVSRAAVRRGTVTTGSTRWHGLVTPSDLLPMVLQEAGFHLVRPFRWTTGLEIYIQPGMEIPRLVEQGASEPFSLLKVDRLDRMLSDRYRLRVPTAKWYGAYGAAVLAAGAALTVPRFRRRWVAGPVLGLAFVPVGLAAAAPVPAGHDAAYLALAGLLAVSLGLLGARVGRSPVRGMGLALLLGAAVIVGDILAGSPLMRFSALEMGVMTGSRFYGIGNEYMGALVGMAAIGLGALMQTVSLRGCVAALLGALVTLVIGLGRLGANWGGSFTAAAALVALWLFCLPKVRARHALLAALALLLSIVIPPAVDLLGPPWERSHIGAAANALLTGDVGSVTEIIRRKVAIATNVVRRAPWSLLGALLCTVVFWLQLRPTGPARPALQGQRALAAGIAAALCGGVVAMVVNDSGPAAGFGSILAALSAVVFLAARAPGAAP